MSIVPIEPVPKKPDTGWPLSATSATSWLASSLAPTAVEELRAAFGPATPGSTLHVGVDEHTPAKERWLSLAEHTAVVSLLDELLGDYQVTEHGRDPGKGAGRQGLHADRPPGRMHELDGLTVLWMLDDFLDVNGATRVVPHSTVVRRRCRGASPNPESSIRTRSW